LPLKQQKQHYHGAPPADSHRTEYYCDVHTTIHSTTTKKLIIPNFPNIQFLDALIKIILIFFDIIENILIIFKLF
jgi:hypothetical protein